MHLAYSRYKEKQERNRDKLAKRRERFPIKKDGKTKSCKVVEENQTSVEDARQKHVQILEKVYGAQRLVSETSSRASVLQLQQQWCQQFPQQQFRHLLA